MRRLPKSIAERLIGKSPASTPRQRPIADAIRSVYDRGQGSGRENDDQPSCTRPANKHAFQGKGNNDVRSKEVGSITQLCRLPPRVGSVYFLLDADEGCTG